MSLIIIDESELDCFIAQKIIKFTYKNSSVKSYLSATTALQDISNGNITLPLPAIILLDLQMPVMNGFEFVEAYEQLPAEITGQYKIHILSSTRNQNDITRILSFKSVNGMIEKPLTKEKMQNLAMQYDF